jgi:hypothetical protein
LYVEAAFVSRRMAAWRCSPLVGLAGVEVVCVGVEVVCVGVEVGSLGVVAGVLAAGLGVAAVNGIFGGLTFAAGKGGLIVVGVPRFFGTVGVTAGAVAGAVAGAAVLATVLVTLSVRPLSLLSAA